VIGNRTFVAFAPCTRLMPFSIRHTRLSAVSGVANPCSTCVVATPCRYVLNVEYRSVAELSATHRHRVSIETGKLSGSEHFFRKASK
jgi:hypothetical protein